MSRSGSPQNVLPSTSNTNLFGGICNVFLPFTTFCSMPCSSAFVTLRTAKENYTWSTVSLKDYKHKFNPIHLHLCHYTGYTVYLLNFVFANSLYIHTLMHAAPPPRHWWCVQETWPLHSTCQSSSHTQDKLLVYLQNLTMTFGKCILWL